MFCCVYTVCQFLHSKTVAPKTLGKILRYTIFRTKKHPNKQPKYFFCAQTASVIQTFLHTATQDFLQQKTACFSRRFVVDVLLQPYCRAKSPQISRLGRQWRQPCLCPFRRSRCKHPGRVFRPALHARWLGIFP